MNDRDTCQLPKARSATSVRLSKVQLPDPSDQIIIHARSVSAGSLRMSPKGRQSEDTTDVLKQAVLSNALKRSDERSTSTNSASNAAACSSTTSSSGVDDEGMQSARSSDDEAAAIKEEKRPNSIRIRREFINGYSKSDQAALLRLFKLIGRVEPNEFKIKSNQESLCKAIFSKRNSIIEAFVSLNWITIPPLTPRPDNHYDLVVILLAGPDEYLPFESAVFNFVQRLEHTYSRAFIIYDNAHLEAKIKITADFSEYIGGIDTCLYEHANLPGSFLSKVLDDKALRCEAQSILVVSAYDVINTLFRHLRSNPNPAIDLFCANTCKEAVPSVSFLQRLITENILAPNRENNLGI